MSHHLRCCSSSFWIFGNDSACFFEILENNFFLKQSDVVTKICGFETRDRVGRGYFCFFAAVLLLCAIYILAKLRGKAWYFFLNRSIVVLLSWWKGRD